MGFDWENIEGVIDKVVEEVKELNEAGTQEEKAREFGDLLFTLVNVARRLGIDAESALREASERFTRRFTYMEELCRQRGMNIGILSLKELDALWEVAKKMVGG